LTFTAASWDGELLPSVALSLTGEIVPDLSLSPPRLVGGPRPVGERFEEQFTIASRTGRAFRVLSVKGSPGSNAKCGDSDDRASHEFWVGAAASALGRQPLSFTVDVQYPDGTAEQVILEGDVFGFPTPKSGGPQNE
jgi:hypothetical protein